MPLVAIKYIANSFALLLFITILGGFLHFFIIEFTEINGVSMEPTYIDTQKVIINKITPLLTPLKRGETVSLFDEYRELLLIKRVVGLPGEQIVIRDGAVYVRDQFGNENILTEPYIQNSVLTKPKIGNEELYPILGPHEYFVLGDNRGRSTDSRIYGSVDRSQIVGVVFPIPFASSSRAQN
ncbi:signal peptidase I [Candidatus Uhrbacteria bacterium CG_4_10_14_0_2_um_filter_41_7]|uniref:Signal peptidase I n=1 Tax=Candidatus Uhrbacteria bacterium CG_4_9_14_3_um_filter_41_35 TaxID=1975034 RepID=A0A2M7XG81_9BACT|nr:MAG: signal peptidase I [Candidatus Uhrbacteria bacterium CG11_big_fil_rev_8_21_14_0_20_41_9]PIZ54173.1 MAG: signal peptidase I [Candidatus Uhrbacteria bacterium CG_4_10_14_0_2_um_filter_41_7]PJA46862.1 MAG: signal peptidase I [Candidatus Uhrbacteria bacterium CG_4_9_14_3_um_filter_41_35]